MNNDELRKIRKAVDSKSWSGEEQGLGCVWIGSEGSSARSARVASEDEPIDLNPEATLEVTGTEVEARTPMASGGLDVKGESNHLGLEDITSEESGSEDVRESWETKAMESSEIFGGVPRVTSGQEESLEDTSATWGVIPEQEESLEGSGKNQ